MFDSLPARVLLLVFVLAAQAGLLVWGGASLVAAGDTTYPNEYALALNYDAHVGQRVEVTADVVSTDPLVVHRSFQYREVRLTIRDADVDASPGDRLVVFGVAEPDHTIRAIDAYVVPQRGLWYASAVSLLGGLWVLARIVRQWRVTTDGWGLTPRGERDA